MAAISHLFSTTSPLVFFVLVSTLLPPTLSSNPHTSNPCRSYCGNITVDYPFSLRSGCGHPGFRNLFFCINDVLMFHILSGSYRVLDIDYAYQSLTLHDPHMSTCDTIVLGARGNGFAVERWRAPYFNPAPDNVFMLLGCSSRSALFQGFPEKHLPCRNVSGMGCEDYYGCPAWSLLGRRKVAGSSFQSAPLGPPECCAVGFESIKEINLSKLECGGYSSAYSLAPLRRDGASGWSYGIRVKYSAQGSDAFCQACEATGGTCGYASGDDDTDGDDDGEHNKVNELCLCGSVNSTSNCDSDGSSSSGAYSSPNVQILTGILMSLLPIWMTTNQH